MDKKQLIIRVLTGVMAVSFVGLGVTFLFDIAGTKKQPGKALSPQTQSKLIDAVQRNREMTAEINALRDRHVESIEKIAAKDEEVERLVQKLAANVQLIQKLTRDRQTTEASLNELEDDAAAVTELETELERQRAAYEAEKQAMAKRMETLQQELEAAREEAEAAKSMPREPAVSGEASSVSNVRDELEDFAAPLREPKPGATYEAASLKESMKLFQELKQENQSWKDREQNYESRIRDFESEIQKLEKEQERAEERWKKDAERARKDFEKEVQRRVKHVESRLESAQRDLKKAREELLKKEEKLETLEEENKATEKQYKIMEHETQVAREEKERLESQVAELQDTHEEDKLAFYYNLALSHTHAGLFKDAEKMYLKVLEINPKDAETHYNLGILYEDHLMQHEAGQRHYQKFLDYTTDQERRRKVMHWVDVSKRRYGKGRETASESADAAYDKLFIATPG